METPVYLSVADILLIHKRVIDEFGGDQGLRDRGLLESAVAMPRATFAGKNLHAGITEQAAAYHFHLCANHPFVDGNKRIAVASAEVFLLANGYELDASDDELEEITMGLASGQRSKAQVVDFFAAHVRSTRDI